jgi:hypothetical protein
MFGESKHGGHQRRFSFPISTSVPPYFGKSTTSPDFKFMACNVPFTSRMPGPVATTVPSCISLALSVGSSIPPDVTVAVCYLCLDAGLLEPLRRDCACRGTDAGFVHMSCLAGYSATKSMQTNDMDEFRKPWRDCPSCHQQYQNELAVDIATEFVSFVRRKYPHNTRRQVESLHLKLLD